MSDPMHEVRTDYLEAEVKDDCEWCSGIPCYWSDWFGHTALLLAFLYEMRGHGPFDAWWERVTSARGGHTLYSLANGQIERLNIQVPEDE